jgi:hypothetical protein
VSSTLLDWRRRVAEMYAAVRDGAVADPEGTLARFRAARDRLFATHPDTPLPSADRAGFEGLSYWPHDPGWRFVVPVEDVGPEASIAPSLTGDHFPLRRIGLVRLPVGELELYWMDVYGGGVFLPFQDGTAGSETYGAGRYLLDTIKGADLGGDRSALVIDFNYAYHPSCAYDPAWSCPLAPPANRLAIAIRAGERLPPLGRGASEAPTDPDPRLQGRR